MATAATAKPNGLAKVTPASGLPLFQGWGYCDIDLNAPAMRALASGQSPDLVRTLTGYPSGFDVTGCDTFSSCSQCHQSYTHS